ncbi:uncharacterized protein LOC142985265 [Anticarsia gemmatalis]|uniref:uncharacterized protein LOC142985265 n=1 Tax=Anticarsia gemmatalis TaxID=129554 RepID=UPI003F76735B
MAKTESKVSKFAACILYVVNFIIMVVCCITFSFGLWIIISPVTLSTILDATGSNTLKALVQDMLTLQVGIAVSLVSVLLFFVCFMGFYGAVTGSAFLLFMYAALVLLFLLLECAFLHYFSTNLIEKGLQDDGQWTHAMRLIFKCCEHNTTVAEVKNPPWSCCGPDFYPDNCTSTAIYKKDCNSSITSWLDNFELPIYLLLAVIHVVLSSCSLLRRSCYASRSHS